MGKDRLAKNRLEDGNPTISARTVDAGFAEATENAAKGNYASVVFKTSFTFGKYTSSAAQEISAERTEEARRFFTAAAMPIGELDEMFGGAHEGCATSHAERGKRRGPDEDIRPTPTFNCEGCHENSPGRSESGH